MNDLNTCALIGRLVRDPELKTSTSGRNFCSFTIAVNGFKSKDGEQHVDFINCMVNGVLADNLCKYGKKGTKLSVLGSLTVSTSKKEDKTYTNTFVNVNQFQLLDRAPGQEGQAKPETKSQPKLETPNSVEDLSDDDLPF